MAAPTEHRLDAAARIEAIPDDDLRHEYLAGQHVMSPNPAAMHAAVASNLQELLTEALPADGDRVVLQAVNVSVSGAESFLVPDLAVVAKAALRPDPVYLDPKHVDLVVEITSDSTRKRDFTEKVKIYGAWQLPYLVVERRTGTVWYYEKGEIIDVMMDRDPLEVTGWSFPAVRVSDLFQL